MNIQVCCVVLLAIFSVGLAYPAQQKGYDVEVVPLESQPHYGDLLPDFNEHPIVDTGAWEPSFNFFGFYQNLEAALAKMRDQLGTILRRTQNGNDFPNLDGLDPNKTKSTTFTKVVDGHQVTVNQTSYSDQSPDGVSFYHGTFEIHPVGDELPNQPEKSKVNTDAKKDREPLDEETENEITKQKEDTMENFDIDEPNQKWDDLDAVEELSDNNVENNQQQQQVLYDLSNDIYVNQLMADAGAPFNPDAEFVEPINTGVQGSRNGKDRETIRYRK